MITNFQLKPRKCKYHTNLIQQFICMNKQCQYRALLCSQCTRQNHSTHLHEIRSIQSFIQTFKQKVKFYQTQFQKDKVVINVKQIIKTKISELDQIMNQIFISLVRILEKEKYEIVEKFKVLEEKYEARENQYKKNLQSRYDVLQYLSSLKNSTKALQARILCSSQWGVVSLKNSLLDIKNLSANQQRNVAHMTDKIIQQTDRVLKQDNFLYSLKLMINQQHSNQRSQQQYPSGGLYTRNARITSFIQKSFGTNPTANTNSPTTINTPKSSRVLNTQRPRTHSLSGINLGGPCLSRMISNPNLQQMRKPSLQHISSKIPSSQSSLDGNRYLKGLKKLQLSKVIIK